MTPPAPDRVPYLRLVPPVEPRAAVPRLGLWLRLSILVEALRRRRARTMSVERLSDHERRDVGLETYRPAQDPRDLILRM
ncbi:hypothetical protein KXS07_18120 [Inquilinus limosus]|uniref:hypothetical protein n=1 Tax=Inquilinus limosus TaxID=171674 RepID=UPI003F138599